ncbi:helix-turn-helix domain-containing protein [Marinifilum sp.]|uniref:helix-turn-helix domain-containing protein n=1 Tax=Marinifilum sp. TaxID=2033137 RepID=UPI003BAD1AA2
MDSITRIENISELHKMLGQEEPKHPLIGLIDFSKVKPQGHGGNIKISTGFYTVLQKNLCPGALRYGRNYYDFQEGTLFFLAPNQVISIEDPDETKDIYGWGLFFHPELIRKTSLSSKMKDYNFFSYNLHEALHLSDKEQNKLKGIVEDIELELSQNIDKHSKTLIISTLELLLNYCNRYYDRQFITRTNQNNDLIVEFEGLINNYFNTDVLKQKGFPSVKDFANQLGLSPNYLSDILKKETGRNGTDFIQYHIIEKAKNKLLGSSVSISEIAYDLGFEYPQYFSKMFKKKTGMTPGEYRSLN